MKTAVFFDLDNTLYPEKEFVRSGFMAVAKFLASLKGFPGEEELFQNMSYILARDGRGVVFDTLLRDLGCYTSSLVMMLVHVYRMHHPNIGLYDGVDTVFSALREAGVKTGIITDGIALVQRNKLNALGLEKVVDVVICTDAMGREFWKPSPVPFFAALESLGKVKPAETTYVADDTSKDFIAPRSIGMSSIRVNGTGLFGTPASSSEGVEADIVVAKIEEIIPIVLG